MPDFGTPFSGNSLGRKLSKEELIRAVRFMISAEYEAVQLYTQISEATDIPEAKTLIEEITREEVVHAGEFLKLLSTLSPDEMKAYQEGVNEATEAMKKMASRVASRFLAERPKGT